MNTTPRRLPRGFSTVELLLVMVIMGVVFALVVPRMTVVRDRTALRAAKQQFTAAVSATRAAATQKGKNATMTMVGSTIGVRVRSGLAGTLTRVLCPLRLDQTLGVTLTPIGGAPNVIEYDTRGLLAPVPDGILRYQLSREGLADTVCISRAGLIRPKGCAL